MGKLDDNKRCADCQSRYMERIAELRGEKGEVVEDDYNPYEPAYTFREFYIPNYMWGAIERYVQAGIPPGDFLTAVICNDLREAVGRADDINLKNLPAYVAYFHNEVPGLAWGSKEKMQAWMAARRKDLDS